LDKRHAMRLTALLPLLFMTSPALPCTVFLVSDGNGVFGGNNEDGIDLAGRMWTVPAEGPGKHGRVYFGLSDGFPQGGVNDAGLFYDGLALPSEPVPPSPDRPISPGNIADRALSECATVEEAIALFERHDRKYLETGQLLFGDRTGDAAIIEGNAVIRKRGSSLLATNFRQSRTPPASATCERYRIGREVLQGAAAASVELCRRTLAAVHYEGSSWTLYSNIYDLKAGKIHLYHFHDFSRPVVVDVAEEIAKGPRSCEISSLFPESFAYSQLRRKVEKEVAARRDSLVDRTVDPASFAACAGRYRVVAGFAAGMEIAVLHEGGKLYVSLPIQGKFELTPRGRGSFVAVTASGEAEIVFSEGKEGAIESAVAKYQGVEVRLAKVGAGRPEGKKAGERRF
jgi:hypothetical protein